MQILFQHPTTSDHYTGNVAPEATGALCVQALVRDNFLKPGKDYDRQVVRTGRVIAPLETLAECQVQERDNVQVLRRETGA